MAVSERIQARLGISDPRLLRESGAVGDAARRRVLSGSRVAVISPGWPGKRFMYEHAHALGVELVLCGERDHWSRSLVDEGVAARFVEYDWSGDPDAAARDALRALAEESSALDGVITFWEDAVPTAMRVAEALGLPGSPPSAADSARSKERTLAVSRAAGLPTPAYVHLQGPASLAGAAGQIGFPAVLKPVYGAQAIGCIRVNDLAELEAAFARVAPIVTPVTDPIFMWGSDLLLEEYLDGIEFDVDLVLADGNCVFSAVSENWPTAEPYLSETGLHTPSTSMLDRRTELIDHCVKTTLALGFRDAALHCEAKVTSRGPRIVEVNARLSGGRVADYHRFVTGVDLIEQVLFAAVGIPVAPSMNPEPACGVAELVIYAHRTGVLRHDRFLDHLATDPSVHDAEVVAHTGQQVTSHVDGFPTELGRISVVADDPLTARARGRAIVGALDITID